MEMARQRRPPVPPRTCLSDEAPLEDLWAILLELAPTRFTSNPPTFVPRTFVRPNLWRIPEPEDPAPFHEQFLRGTLTRATLIARIKHMATDHFPSAPRRPSTHVARFERHGLLNIHGFTTPEAMRSFIELTLSSSTYRWTNDYAIYAPDLDLTISSDKLEEIMDTTQTIRLHAPYPQLAQQISGAAPFDRPTPSPLASSSSLVTADGPLTPQRIAELKNLTPAAVRRKLRKLGLRAPIDPSQLHLI